MAVETLVKATGLSYDEFTIMTFKLEWWDMFLILLILMFFSQAIWWQDGSILHLSRKPSIALVATTGEQILFLNECFMPSCIMLCYNVGTLPIIPYLYLMDSLN